jgi:DNA repair protein RadD
MYRAAIRERARDGIRTHGTLGAYLRDFRACSKVFEMFVAERMAIERGVPFWLWEDVPHEMKVARGLARRDLGIDVTDGVTTIVQCKLRKRTVTWGECATFFGCAVAYTDGAYAVMWRDLVLARNACSKLSPNFAALAATRPFDAPIGMDEFGAFVAATLLPLLPLDGAEPIDAARVARVARVDQVAPVESLRDYQREAIELCCADAGPAYVVLPTGTGKSVVIAHVAMRVEGRVLVLVPLVVLLEQLVEVLSRHGCTGVAAVGRNDEDHTLARVVVCVFNSAHKLDLGSFERILVDEAHFISRPAVYSDLEGLQQGGNEGREGREGLSGYAAVRAAMAMRPARLFSATIDIPGGAPRCTRSLRAMIDAGYLSDYTLHVPVFEAGATNEDLAANLVRTYRSMLVFCATRAEGTLFCAALNARGACAKYIDCYTPRAERRETVRQFKSGSLAFVVNVRVLSVGFDAPITRGVCFVHMPASQAQAIQVIGRCLRTHPDKHMAHVVLPVVTGEAGDGADVRVRDFMRVLAQSDARFADSLRARGGAFVDVHLADAEAGSEADTVVAVERTEAALLFERIYDSMGRALFGAWDTRLAELVAYHAEHARVPCGKDRIGRWAATQRSSRETMEPGRKAKLEALPWWRWSQSAIGAWEGRLAELVAYHAEHACLPVGGDATGKWVVSQRARRSTMAPERKAKLEALPWWRWSQMEPEMREYHRETTSRARRA